MFNPARLWEILVKFFWAEATSRPSWSKIIALVEVVPSSIAKIYFSVIVILFSAKALSYNITVFLMQILAVSTLDTI